MTPLPAPVLSPSSQALCLLLILLVPSAAAGLALINTGLGRSRNAAHSMLSTLAVVSVAAVVYFVVGFCWQAYLGRPALTFTIHGKLWNWLGSERMLLRGIELDGSPLSLAVVLGMFSVAVTASIPLGGAAERWRLGSCCTSTALLAGFTWPVFAHWVNGGGWLAQLGVNCGLGRGFLDSGGAAPIQVVGGLTALVMTWILGPRHAKYVSEGMPAALPGHNAGLVLFGCFLAWLGWLGLDGAGAILFTGIQPGYGVLVAVNATLAAAAALLAALAITRARFGKTDASLCANSWVAGLVASSAGCAVVRPAAAVLIGLIAGALVVFSVEWLERLRVDDPGGAVSVHAIGGLWGILAIGMFVDNQWLAQLAGAATLIGFVLPVTYGLNWLLDRFRPQRVPPPGERQGLDLFELGAGAYPDFLTHNEDF